MSVCPRCEQGIVLEKVIKSTNKKIFICDECEAVWFHKEDVGMKPFIDYGTYMVQLSLPPLWSELL